MESYTAPISQDRNSMNSRFVLLHLNLLQIRNQRAGDASVRFLLPAGNFGSLCRIDQYFGSDRVCCSGRKTVRLGELARSYRQVPRNVWNRASGALNPNMDLDLV